jgi:hypothetical protein
MVVLLLGIFRRAPKCENKNDENTRSLSKPLNIGTHCEALETSFQMVPLAL